MAAHSSVLDWRIPGTGSLVGCRLWGHTESDTTEAIQQRQQQLSRKFAGYSCSCFYMRPVVSWDQVCESLYKLQIVHTVTSVG